MREMARRHGPRVVLRHLYEAGTPPAKRFRYALLGLDILSITEDRVTGVWAVADWLGLLVQAQAVTLAAP